MITWQHSPASEQPTSLHKRDAQLSHKRSKSVIIQDVYPGGSKPAELSAFASTSRKSPEFHEPRVKNLCHLHCCGHLHPPYLGIRSATALCETLHSEKGIVE